MKRIPWIDTARGIGLILVIFGHLHVPYLATWIYFFHMPLFFFLSGTVYHGNKDSFKTYLIKKVKSLIIPYISFGVVIWGFYAVINCIIGEENGLYGSNLNMLKGLLIQKHYWTIWFLTALFFTEVFYYVLDHWLNTKPRILSIISLLICVIGMLRYRFGFGALPWNLDIAFVAQFFFHLGVVFRKSNWLQNVFLHCKLEKRFALAILCLVCNIVSGFGGIKLSHSSLDMSVGLYGNEFLTLLSAISGILFVITIANMLSSRFLLYLGRNTMIIFALHSRIIIVLCNYIYQAIDIFQGDSWISQCLYDVVSFGVVLLTLIPLTEIIKKSKIHMLFGV